MSALHASLMSRRQVISLFIVLLIPWRSSSFKLSPLLGCLRRIFNELVYQWSTTPILRRERLWNTLLHAVRWSIWRNERTFKGRVSWPLSLWNSTINLILRWLDVLGILRFIFYTWYTVTSMKFSCLMKTRCTHFFSLQYCFDLYLKKKQKQKTPFWLKQRNKYKIKVLACFPSWRFPLVSLRGGLYLYICSLFYV